MNDVSLPAAPLSKAGRRTIAGLQRRKQRRREGLFIVEGIRATGEALKAGADVAFAVCAPRLLELEGGTDRAAALVEAGIEAFTVDDRDLQELADTMTPQGILLVCRQPSAELAGLEASSPASGVLIADAVQDPANLGTIIRSAAAFGMDGVVALDGTVDPFNSKVVRGTAGACFHLPVVEAEWPEVQAWLAATERRLLIAAADGDPQELRAPATAWALAIGNEGCGVRDEIRAAAEATVGIPTRATVESLNAGVAASILLFAMTRNHGERGDGDSRPADEHSRGR